jgi:hypothetical protein
MTNHGQSRHPHVARVHVYIPLILATAVHCNTACTLHEQDIGVELVVQPNELAAGRTQSSIALLAQDRARKRIDALLTEVAQKSPLITKERAVEVCVVFELPASDSLLIL